MLEVKVEGRVLTLYLSKLTERLWNIAAKVMTRQSQGVTVFIIKQHETGGTTATKLAVRTGHMRQTTVPRLTKQIADGVQGGTDFGAKYAGVHMGPRGQKTVITPKAAQFLTIPMPGALTAAGMVRGRARDFPGTFIAKGMIFQKQRGGKIVPLFLLRRQVTVPARIHPEDIANEYLPVVAQDLVESMGKEL